MTGLGGSSSPARCLAATAVMAALSLGGCNGGDPPGPDPTDSPPTAPSAGPSEAPDPCPDAPAVDLGRPNRTGPFAEFTLTEPGRVWITATGFPHGGIFDPDVGTAAVYVGSMQAPPTHDQQRSIVTNTLVDTRVIEETWTALDLEVGAHWLWTSASPTISLKTCDGRAVTDVYAVPAG